MAVIGLCTHGEDLPQNDAKRPDIRLQGEFSVKDRFGRHPSYGKHVLASSHLRFKGVLKHSRCILRQSQDAVGLLIINQFLGKDAKLVRKRSGKDERGSQIKQKNKRTL